MRYPSDQKIQKLVEKANITFKENPPRSWHNGLLIGNGNLAAIGYIPGNYEWVINKTDVFDGRLRDTVPTPHDKLMKMVEERGDRTTYFISDIEKMWSICRADPGLWNTQLNVMEKFESFAVEPSLDVAVDLSLVRAHLKRAGDKYVCVKGLLKTLEQKRLIHCYTNDDQNISFTYKNEQVKRCLTKAGTILELKLLLIARSVRSKDGTLVYTDAMNGVFIDWDGDLHNPTDDEKDTENEIDVLLMRGLVPVFISCKNGAIFEDELYKLETVASRFGGVYAKKVLIATYLGKNPKSMEHFRQRTEDMKIKFIDGVHKLTEEEFARKIRNLLNS
jgi:hypothetical protein